MESEKGFTHELRCRGASELFHLTWMLGVCAIKRLMELPSQFIIPEMKAEVLDGCSLVFSGMIPRESNPST